MHAGMVGLDGEKMSKSKGNLELVSRLRHAGVDPMAIRLALLDHHYRTDWEWTRDQLEPATDAAWRGGAGVAQQRAPRLPAQETIDAMRDALRSDLDAPAALSAVDAWVAGQPRGRTATTPTAVGADDRRQSTRCWASAL